jgi:RHS repeat-associated protein
MLKYSSEQYVTGVPAMPGLLLNNRVSMHEVMGLHQYGYDKLCRLTSVDYARYPDQAYSYDPSGYRLTLAVTGKDTQTYTYNPTNSLKDVTEGQKQTTYEWDKAGNLKTQEVAIGGATPAKTQYTFDGANRLAGANLPSGQSLTYGYDFDGHRVYRKEGDGKTWFVFDGLSVVIELDGNRKAVAAIVPGISKTNLSYHIPVAEFYLYDGLGSVVMLTDVLGNPTQMYQYDVFGGTQNLKRDPFNRYRFVGLAQDDSLGLTYMNARWYDAGVGRYISRDPVVNLEGDTQRMNPYVYALNNPISMTDREGRNVLDDIKQYAKNAWEAAKDADAYLDSLFARNEETSDQTDHAKRERIVERAEELIGTPYESPSNMPYSIDCSRLTAVADPGLKDMTAREQRRHKIRTSGFVPKREDLERGDTIYWEPDNPKEEHWHTGVVTDNEGPETRFVDSSRKAGRVKERVTHGNGRIPGAHFAGGGKPE